MLGSTPEEEVRLAQFKGFYSDFVRNFFDFCIGKGDYEEDKAKFKEVAHAKLAKLATFRGTREYMVAAHFTLADLLMFELLSLLGMLFEEDVGKDKYWDEYFHKVRNIPSIKSYRESGRFIKEPVAGPQSRFKPMKMQ
jgi:glutathione S-transferase